MCSVMANSHHDRDDQLINPTGLEIGSDGEIYISNKGFITARGAAKV